LPGVAFAYRVSVAQIEISRNANMKPAPFVHVAPGSLTEVVALLAEHAPDARVLAGGQSLVPMMNFRLSRPSVLIDLNTVPGLAYIRDDGDHLNIGAMTRQRTIENSDLVRTAAPLLHAATLNIGHLPIRSRGTIGGSISNADPAAEYPATALALDCVMVLQGAAGERRVAAADFFEGVLATATAPDELLTAIIVPKAPQNSGSAFVEIARRHGDFALAGVAAQIAMGGGDPDRVQLAACGVGPGPVRLSAAEAVIMNDGVSDTAIKSAARAAAKEVAPETDLHATADYRRRLTAVMTQRAIVKALENTGVAA
jgi:aerobic carbon-monoxide dehydrogenase medium subunit